MPKCLKASRENKCNGCELCVLESQRQIGKVGLEETLIRVFRKSSKSSEYPQYKLEIDPRMNSLDIKKIKDICPQEVFDIEEE